MLYATTNDDVPKDRQSSVLALSAREFYAATLQCVQTGMGYRCAETFATCKPFIDQLCVLIEGEKMGSNIRKSAKLASCIWTIGHSTRTFEHFLELLQSQNIEAIADVRRFPGSRKYPQFNAESLNASLHEHDIAYEWFQELGGRRKPDPNSHNTAWRNASFRAYADYIETNEFRDGLDRLMQLANERRTAVMCSEAVWWRCHRSLISDVLKVEGVQVLHILEIGKVVEHPYTSAAQIVDGRLSYAAGQGSLL